MDWINNVIKEDEYKKFLKNGKDFINEQEIEKKLEENKNPDKAFIRDILQKSLSIETLSPSETAALLNVKDQDLWLEIFKTAGIVKKKVYDNRIVTFAPLYCGNYCVNNCLYCAFRTDNQKSKRRKLSMEEIRSEIKVLTGKIGHKRLIIVFGEHPSTGPDYIAKTIETIYDVKSKTRRGNTASIRRVNINAAPMSIDNLKMLQKAGIGTYQVFQETYHHATYAKVHPSGTLKSNYKWRLYSMHRALEAGIDDIAIGVLFGLYDWRFEIMALQYHALDLEEQFDGIGPHTVSFPRLEPAANTPFYNETPYKVSDDDFKKIIAVLRLSIPYTGLILTAREPSHIRDAVIPLGITQTDASTRIGIGAYSDRYNEQEAERQQFILGDTRTLDEIIRVFSNMGYITSFCTAGYRCGRTGTHIMSLLRNGNESKFCKLNAVLTFREWLDDFASADTKQAGERVIKLELAEIETQLPDIYPRLREYYKKIENGERDLYF